MIDFKNRVAIVTGAGGGLGKEYALALAKRGCKVVVNDLGGSVHGTGSNSRVADVVVDEIRASGGEATANYDSVVDGARIVQTAMEAYGRVDIVVNNAGILRDKSFHKMSQSDWDLVQMVHVQGAKNVTQAAWPQMRKQRYGRVINISSVVGLYGNFGQANYGVAKAGMVGFTNCLALEGKKYDIKVNCVAPLAYSRMTEGTPTAAIVKQRFPAKAVGRIILVLASEQCPQSGCTFEAGGNWFAEVRPIRASGALMKTDSDCDDLLSAWSDVTNFKNSEDPKVMRNKTGATASPKAFAKL